MVTPQGGTRRASSRPDLVALTLLGLTFALVAAAYAAATLSAP